MNNSYYAIFDLNTQEMIINTDFDYFEIFNSRQKCEVYIKEELGPDFEPREIEITLKK